MISQLSRPIAIISNLFGDPNANHHHAAKCGANNAHDYRIETMQFLEIPFRCKLYDESMVMHEL